jgi:hypothetical protein
MDNLEKVEQAAQKFEAKAAQIENIEKAANTANETATKTAEAVNSVKSSVSEIANEVKGIADWKVSKDEADKKNQEALDNLLTEVKANRNAMPTGKKSFGEAFAAQVEKEWDSIQGVRKGKSHIMEVKTVGNMTLGANLTGDSVVSYSPAQAILPAQSINFRDLVRTTSSPTGTYVHYKENGAGEGSISLQTEGSAKTQRDYDFAEVKTVNEFIAGFVRFSKQMRNSLPFFQGTLPALLLRDFYKAENAKFFTDVTGASGISTSVGSETEDIKTLIDAISYQHNSDFQASYILVNHIQMARLQKLLYTTGNYQGSGGAVGLPNGTIAIAGVPVIPASWVTDDKGLIIDQTFVERVEVESVRVEFFEQDSDNVQKNLITARIECQEAINLMLPASARYFDFGNAS